MQKPLLTKGSALTQSLRKKIEDLILVCRSAGDIGVDYPLGEDDTCSYLLWGADGPETDLYGALAVMPLSYDSCECIAYVRPDMRKKGYFSQILLPEAAKDFPESDFIFPVREPDPAAVSVLMSIGAEFDCREYLMELKLDAAAPCAQPAPGRGTEAENLNIRPKGLPKIYYYPSEEGPFGSCRIERTSKDSVCLYGVEIKPHLRNQGYGVKMILSLIDELKSYGISRVYLHVGADNLPAVSLYEKAGFRTTETLSFYLF